MEEREARQRFAEASVGRLGTVDSRGRPAVVPFCFAVDGDRLYTAVDEKPKSTIHLGRLTNIERCPDVSVVVDHYEDDWTRLWWVRARGLARVVHDGDDHRRGVALLRAKYRQYETHALTGPVVVVELLNWFWWAAVG